MEVTLLIYMQHIEFNSYVIQLIARALGSNIIPENLMPSLRKCELDAGWLAMSLMFLQKTRLYQSTYSIQFHQLSRRFYKYSICE